MIPEWNREIYVGQQKLRCGYTTGSAAAAASFAAAYFMRTGIKLEYVSLKTPGNTVIPISVEYLKQEQHRYICGVRKDAGDDVDMTDGILIVSTVWEDSSVNGLVIEGGEGVGIVTKPGLQVSVGMPAINPIPRKMIEEETAKALSPLSLHHRIQISVPEGSIIASKTYNPYLGIQNGISILGTTGIVEPYSIDAIKKTIELELSSRCQMGEKRLLLTPGNYGSSFLKERADLAAYLPVQCSNFIGDTIDMAVRMQFEEILLVGHIGKLVKLAGGVMNTHSKMADCRAELFTAHAALAGADITVIRRLMASLTTDESLEILSETDLTETVLASLAERAQYYCNRRAGNHLSIGICMFNLSRRMLVQSKEGKLLWNKWAENKEYFTE